MKGYALKVARLDAIRALQENPDPLANLPLADYSPKQIEEYKFPDLPGLNVAHPFPQLDWETYVTLTPVFFWYQIVSNKTSQFVATRDSRGSDCPFRLRAG